MQMSKPFSRSLFGVGAMLIAWGCSGTGAGSLTNPFSGVVSKGAGVSGIPGDAYTASIAVNGAQMAITAYDSTNPEVYNGSETDYSDDVTEDHPDDIFSDGYPTHDYVRKIHDSTMSASSIYYTSKGYVGTDSSQFTGEGLSKLSVTGALQAAVALPDSGRYLCTLIKNGPLYLYSVSANQPTIELRNSTTLAVTGIRTLGSGFSMDTAIDLASTPESTTNSVTLYMLGIKDGKARVQRTTMDFNGILTSTLVDEPLATNDEPVSIAVDDQFFYIAYSNGTAHTSHIDVYGRGGGAMLTSLTNSDCQEISSIAAVHTGGVYRVYADAREANPQSGASVSGLFLFQ